MIDEHRDRDHQEFEAAGDEVVRANVLLNRYEREKRAAAEAWLRERLEARRRVLISDELYIAVCLGTDDEVRRLRCRRRKVMPSWKMSSIGH